MQRRDSAARFKQLDFQFPVAAVKRSQPATDVFEPASCRASVSCMRKREFELPGASASLGAKRSIVIRDTLSAKRERFDQRQQHHRWECRGSQTLGNIEYEIEPFMKADAFDIEIRLRQLNLFAKRRGACAQLW